MTKTRELVGMYDLLDALQRSQRQLSAINRHNQQLFDDLGSAQQN
jgi:hypothetical protein